MVFDCRFCAFNTPFRVARGGSHVQFELLWFQEMLSLKFLCLLSPCAMDLSQDGAEGHIVSDTREAVPLSSRPSPALAAPKQGVCAPMSDDYSNAFLRFERVAMNMRSGAVHACCRPRACVKLYLDDHHHVYHRAGCARPVAARIQAASSIFSCWLFCILVYRACIRPH